MSSVMIMVKRSKKGLSFLHFSLFLMTLGVLILPFFLTPSPQGYGTHQQLGLPPCPLLTFFHTKCPTCGLTTSFTNMTSGKIAPAFENHLMGPPFFFVLILLALLLLIGTFKPDWLGRLFLLKTTRFMVDSLLFTWLICWLVSV